MEIAPEEGWDSGAMSEGALQQSSDSEVSTRKYKIDGVQ